LFAALLSNGINSSVVGVLRRLYFSIKGYISLWSGADSRHFEVARGVRQGDPLSPILFNLVLDGALQEVSTIWQKRGYGSNIGHEIRGRRLTHIAFADDQTLIANSWLSLRRMIELLRDALLRRGLSLHPSKCKVQTNQTGSFRRGTFRIAEGFSVEILQEGQCLELLGTVLSLTDVTGYEISHRVAVGWRKFWSMRQLLLNHTYSLKKRLKLFASTVSGTILWAAESWTPRAAELEKLRVTQNAMLRKIVNIKRAGEETYVEWLVRSTHKANDIAASVGISSWVHTHFMKKWNWAGHVARMPCDRWASKVTHWRDAASGEFGMSLKRPARRRWMKFEGPLRRWCALGGKENWQTFAANREAWQAVAPDFARWASNASSE
jgi:hypothetical protein